MWADKKSSGLAHNFAQHDLLDPGSLVQFFFYFGPSLAVKIFLFRYDTSDFYAGSVKGLEFKGPLWDPIRLLANLTTWSMFLVVPMFYCAIFKFRKAQNSTPGMMLSRQIHILMSDLSQGLSDTERKRRKESNIFSAKICFIAWLLEVLSLKDSL